jgi:hypothetical protein
MFRRSAGVSAASEQRALGYGHGPTGGLAAAGVSAAGEQPIGGGVA